MIIGSRLALALCFHGRRHSESIATTRYPPDFHPAATTSYVTRHASKSYFYSDTLGTDANQCIAHREQMPLLPLPNCQRTKPQNIESNDPHLAAPTPDGLKQTRTRLPSDPKLLQTTIWCRQQNCPADPLTCRPRVERGKRDVT
jgi:hypothetical protein